MQLGVPKEIKDKENRVAITPEGVKKFSEKYEVLIEKGAGVCSGFSDEEYEKSGAKIVECKEAWSCDLILKVKEPLESEYNFLKEDQIVFTYLHLAGVTRTLTEALLEKKTTGIAYETIEDEQGKLPLLCPMSAVAGDMATQIGAHYLARFNDGNGTLLGKVNGMVSGKVVVIGGGIVGMHAAKTAVGLGADVKILDINNGRLKELEKEIPGVTAVLSNKETIKELIKDADLLVGAVLVPGGKAPKVVTEDMVKGMQPGSVIVDVAIDQGGCIETSKPTSHSNPVYTKHGVIHYCVTNMPGAYPRTSTIALTKETLDYALKLAEKGVEAVKENEGFMKGVNTYKGFITYEPVAKDLGMMTKFKDLKELI